MSRLVIVSGPPGAGKSTVSRRLALRTDAARAMHMHTDDIYGYIRKGFIEPWKPESHPQNITLARALAAQAAICAQGGYEVFVDGIVGPWFFDPWLEAAEAGGLDLRYVLLLPGEAETVARATARTTPGAMTDAEVTREMWRQFQAHPPPSELILDTTGLSPDETVSAVQSQLAAGKLRLRRPSGSAA